MGGGIFLRRDRDLIEMSEQGYTTEADLQELLATHPDLLSADGDPHRWLLVSREFGVASQQDGSDRWSVDHLFLDENGVPTLVEVKRSTDTRIRREVVGQMLDYAANALSYWRLETIKARFEAGRGDRSAAEMLATALALDVDIDVFWERVGTNLAAGRLRLIFVADVIPSELRAIVEFLNQQMSPTEVLAIEVRLYADDSGQHQTLVPRLIGETQAARGAKGRAPQVARDQASWLRAYSGARGESETAIAERLFTWAKEHEPPLEIRVARQGAMVRVPGRTTLFGLYPSGSVEMGFGNLMSQLPPFDDIDRRRELQARLEAIPDLTIDGARIGKYPSFSVALLSSPDSFNRFVATIDWVIHEAAIGEQ